MARARRASSLAAAAGGIGICWRPAGCGSIAGRTCICVVPDRRQRVVDWGMFQLQKTTADTAIVMLPTEKKVA